MNESPAFKEKPRRSLWLFGLESEQPTFQQRRDRAAELSVELGTEITAPQIPDAEELDLPNPRITPPESLASFCFQDNYERALHSASGNRGNYVYLGVPNPPDVVAHPRNDLELEAILEWCDDGGFIAIPYGGGSSVVDGITPPKNNDKPVVTIDMDQFDQVLEIDEKSRSALIQAGVYGPHLEDQLRPHGYTLRHFPQSFAGSTLGGWIVTRAGGHYATNHTHIDDFVENVKMLTPKGWMETRRLPGDGAGPQPERLVIGSEGTLGIVSEAWMRIQDRPKFRATAGVLFPTWESGYEATRAIVQAKLWPANLRLLDPVLGADSAGLDGVQSLLIIGFEHSTISQREPVELAVEIARSFGGVIDDEDILIDDGAGAPTGRGGAVGAWRDAFIPKGGGLEAGLGMIGGTVETAITWDRWPEFDKYVREQMNSALKEICGGGTLNCRFTHVYVDGPAPYYTFAGARPGDNPAVQWMEFKEAASDAIMKAGGTITHHHAVGRMHRPWYDQQRPDLFAEMIRAAKNAVDPNGIMNPGVLSD